MPPTCILIVEGVDPVGRLALTTDLRIAWAQLAPPEPTGSRPPSLSGTCVSSRSPPARTFPVGTDPVHVNYCQRPPLFP
jgi:hypothetical protein